MSLPLRADSRQIPKHREYTMSKDYNDLMYGYLQSISYDDPDGYRYVDIRDVSATKLGEALDITRQTAGKYFKGLQKLLLVSEKQNQKYRLEPLANEFALLIPNDVLKNLVRMKMQYLISLYVYILWRYTATYEPYNYRLATIKEYIGISSNTYSNSNIITERLDILKIMKLVDYTQINKKNETGGGFHTEQWILWVKNSL